MERNEIKKELYKQKPIAKFDKIVGGVAYWTCLVNETSVKFGIPFTDIQDSEFTNEIPSQLLIRWII